jgi:hypothetical protein
MCDRCNISYTTTEKVFFCKKLFEKITGIKLKPGEIGTFKLVRIDK